jgi:hypothetical protein
VGLDELNEQIGEAAERLTEEPEPLVIAKFSEQYNSIVIVCKNKIDFNHHFEKLSLDKVQCYKSSKVVMLRVVDAKQLIGILSK